MRVSTLTKQNIKVDKNLALVIGHAEGELISYTELVKGIFAYVKLMNLKEQTPPQLPNHEGPHEPPTQVA
jgi:hypothetical protein